LRAGIVAGAEGFGGNTMKAILLTAAGLALVSGAAAAQAPAAHTMKLSNGEKQAITAVYASAPGRKDWGDDLLGKQVGAAGKTVTLKITSADCKVDLQMLMNDGTMVVKPDVDVCATTDYRFSQQAAPAAAPPQPPG
jgi:hypothetical protein